MEHEKNNDKGKITAEKALKMLQDEGLNVTLEQAGLILDFLKKLANIAVSKYLKRKS